MVWWPTGVNALRAMSEKRIPNEKWKQFKLLKRKISSGKFIVQKYILVHW